MERPPELLVAADPIWARRAVLLPVFAIVSAVAGALPSFSPGANVMVLGTGGTLFWVGVARTGERPIRPGLARGAVWWVVPIGLFAGVEATGFVLGSDSDHPTFSLLADPVLDRYLARAALFFGWLTGFWGLARR